MRDRERPPAAQFNRGAAHPPPTSRITRSCWRRCSSLYGATFDERWFAWARSLGDELLERFADGERGGFFVGAADGEQLIVRRKDLEDTPIPSGSSSAALGLLRLAALTGEARYEDAALGALALAAPMAARYPSAFGHLLCALDFHTAPVRELAIVGPIRRRCSPSCASATAPTSCSRDPTARRAPCRCSQGRTPAAGGAAAAYLCERFACLAPVSDPAALRALLDQAREAPPRLSTSSAAARFSSRWSIREVPGIGTNRGERASSHASATWPWSRRARPRPRPRTPGSPPPCRPRAGTTGCRRCRAPRRSRRARPGPRGRARCSGSGRRRSRPSRRPVELLELRRSRARCGGSCRRPAPGRAPRARSRSPPPGRRGAAGRGRCNRPRAAAAIPPAPRAGARGARRGSRRPGPERVRPPLVAITTPS